MNTENQNPPCQCAGVWVKASENNLPEESEIVAARRYGWYGSMLRIGNKVQMSYSSGAFESFDKNSRDLSSIEWLDETRCACKEGQQEWVRVDSGVFPEPLEVVWISNGKGWTTLGCRSDYYNDIGEDGKEQFFWCWCASNGIIYEEDGRITSECEEDDYDVKFWSKVPTPPNSKHLKK